MLKIQSSSLRSRLDFSLAAVKTIGSGKNIISMDYNLNMVQSPAKRALNADLEKLEQETRNSRDTNSDLSHRLIDTQYRDTTCQLKLFYCLHWQLQ